MRIFNEVDYTFRQNQFGFADYSILADGFFIEKILKVIFCSLSMVRIEKACRCRLEYPIKTCHKTPDYLFS